MKIKPGTLCRFPKSARAIWGNPSNDYPLSRDEVFLLLSIDETVKDVYYEFYFLNSQGIKIMVPSHKDFYFWVKLGYAEILS